MMAGAPTSPAPVVADASPVALSVPIDASALALASVVAPDSAEPLPLAGAVALSLEEVAGVVVAGAVSVDALVVGALELGGSAAHAARGSDNTAPSAAA